MSAVPSPDTPTPGQGARERLATVLRAEGLTDQPAEFDSNIHSWRCEYPDRYGPCNCFGELLDALVAESAAIAADLAASGPNREDAAGVVGLLLAHELQWDRPYRGICSCGQWRSNHDARREHAAHVAARLAAADHTGADATLARVRALADDLFREGDRATERRSYAEGVAKRYAANLIRAALGPATGGDQ